VRKQAYAAFHPRQLPILVPSPPLFLIVKFKMVILLLSLPPLLLLIIILIIIIIILIILINTIINIISPTCRLPSECGGQEHAEPVAGRADDLRHSYEYTRSV
jgi:hypothetical protein